ncbi:MAG: peptidoglycan recognition family protein [Candidatus Binatia bacterium]|nr:peptidoglycan recognition family protein [Candidatus Binatia bacterium]
MNIDKTKSRPWKGIVIHHSTGPDNNTKDWTSIVRYHTSYRVDFNTVDKAEFDRLLKAKKGTSFERPWSDVGYHGGVEMFQGQAVYVAGRPLSEIGAHALGGFNKEYIGLCVIGNFDLAAPRDEIWKKTLEVTRELMAAFNIPISHVIGHRETYDKMDVPRQKTCPGKYWSMEGFREDLVKPVVEVKGRSLAVVRKDGSMVSFKLDDVEKVIFI